MFPPSQGLNLDIEALSGICGSISIACWVVVFSPQIFENFRRASAEGLSIVFIVVWLAGDVFNILGAVLQGVLPTMIILAVYYTLADIVLLAQCFYYRGFTLSDDPTPPPPPPLHAPLPSERSPLLNNNRDRHHRRRSSSSFHSILSARHPRSPTTPLFSPDVPNKPTTTTTIPSSHPSSPSALQVTLLNTLAILLVCLAGIFGWFIGTQTSRHSHQSDPASKKRAQDASLRFNTWGQIFGYLCAVLYLGSRLPQIILNYRRKSTEGVSMLFFLFACMGNLTYVLSIFAFQPVCAPTTSPATIPPRITTAYSTGVKSGVNSWIARDGWGVLGGSWISGIGHERGRGGHCPSQDARELYGRYILVNASWLLGSIGTLILDLMIFVQFFVYRPRDPSLASTSERAVEGDVLEDVEGAVE